MPLWAPVGSLVGFLACLGASFEALACLPACGPLWTTLQHALKPGEMHNILYNKWLLLPHGVVLCNLNAA